MIMAQLDDVKTLLNITDTDLDTKLNLIIKNSEKKVLSYLPSDAQEVPAVLQYIVTELSVQRFNRLGNEGMSNYSEEGESITYSDDEMKPYLSSIEAYLKTLSNATRGVVRFL
jgi:serine/threonine protein kinase HipA of HipAB toxin-antitoxin module